MATSAREVDVNGYITIKDNPISKVGVFQYSGAQIGTPEQIEQGIIDPDKIYNVFRSAEELSAPECIESFKLVPWTNEHAMLGPSNEGLTPAEQKGVSGVTGEEVYFDPEDGYLKSNLRVFSESMANLIQQNAKKELSMGYRCVYDLIQGEYNGEKYDAVQRKLRGNHLALVESGRAGPDVAVLDHFTFTLDENEIKKMSEEKKPSLEEAVVNAIGAMQEAIKGIGEKLDALVAAEAKEQETASDEDAPDMTDTSVASDEDAECEDKKEAAAAMDSALKKLEKDVESLKSNGFKAVMSEVNKRNKLAEQLSHYVGAFDHAEKTVAEVAKYGVEKLGLKSPQGHEATVLETFFTTKQMDNAVYVADSSANASGVNVKNILGAL